jgi:hypothetical protein
MSVPAREYEGALAAQQAEKLYATVLDDIKAVVKSNVSATSGDAKRIIAMAVSLQKDPAGFEKKGDLICLEADLMSLNFAQDLLIDSI